MNKRKFEGYTRNAYEYVYIEEETEDEILITAKMTLKKNSKTAMNFIKKAETKNKLPLVLVLKDCLKQNKS